MKIFYKLVFLFMMMDVYCVAQQTVNIEGEVEALRKKLRDNIPEPKSGNALVYEVTRSKDDSTLTGEIFKSKNRDQALVRLFINGDKEKTMIYLDLRNNDSHMLMLSEVSKGGVEMRGITNVFSLLSEFAELAGNMDDNSKINIYPQVSFYIDGNGVSPSLGFVTTRAKLPWEVLDEDISGIEKIKGGYKIIRKKHGGYFTIHEETGNILEQKETLDGQTRTMKLISSKPWNDEISKLLPDYSKYDIENRNFGKKEFNQLVLNLLSKLSIYLLQDKELADKIKNDPKKIEQGLKEVYLPMWRKNNKLIEIPDAWKGLQAEFLESVRKWTDEEKEAWKNLAKPEAINDLREAYFPRQSKEKMLRLLDFLNKDLELDVAEKKNSDLILLAISRATYEAWAEALVENYLESL